MSHRSSSRANDSASESRRTLNYFSYPYPAYHLEEDSSIDSESEPEANISSCLMSCEIMLQVATWLKTFEEFTQGWVRLGCLNVDTQTTWMQHDYREARAESRNTRIRKKGYVLDDVWEKCEQYYNKTNEAWHNEGYEEDEMWRSGDEKTNYDPPYVNIKTFEVKKYSFKGGHSFVCITDREDDALSPTPPPSLSSPSPRHYHHTTITAPHLTTTAPWKTPKKGVWVSWKPQKGRLGEQKTIKGAFGIAGNPNRGLWDSMGVWLGRFAKKGAFGLAQRPTRFCKSFYNINGWGPPVLGHVNGARFKAMIRKELEDRDKDLARRRR
ncbi:hypothetical protein Tco_0660857 [Tanacetum coccineum]